MLKSFFVVSFQGFHRFRFLLKLGPRFLNCKHILPYLNKKLHINIILQWIQSTLYVLIYVVSKFKVAVNQKIVERRTGWSTKIETVSLNFKLLCEIDLKSNWKICKNPKTGWNSGKENHHIKFEKQTINCVKKYGQNQRNLKIWENPDKSGKIRKADEIPEKKIIISNLRSNPLIV